MSGNPPPGVPQNLITPQGNMPAIGVPNSQDYPRLVFTSPYFETVAIAEIIQPSVTEAVENILPSLVPPYVDNAVLAGIQQYAVLLTGSTMSGPLFLNPLMPTADAQAATKAYVDTMLATAGIPEVPPVPVGQIWGRETGQWTPISQAGGTFLPISGGSMQGNINMSGNTITNMAAVPAMPNGAAPAQWVLNQIASVSLYQGTWNADTNVPDLTQLSTHVNAYTWIALTTSPSGVVIGAAIPGLQGMTVFNGDTIIYSTVAGAFSAIHSGGITLPEADGRYVQLAGSQMSGALLLNANASQNLQAVTLQQLDAAVANTVTPDAPADGQGYLRVGVGTTRWVPGLPLAGGILTGALTLAGPGASGNNAVTVAQMNSAISGAGAGFLPIAGGTMTGALVLNGNAAANLNAVPLQQLNATLNTYAPLQNPAFSGVPTVPNVTPPTSNTTQIANTAFVQSALVNYLPLAGGAVTGATSFAAGITVNGTGTSLNVNSGAVSMAGALVVAGNLTAASLASNGAISSTGNLFINGGVTQVGVEGVYYGDFGGTPGFVGFLPAAGALQAFVNAGFVGNITLTGSDPRWKENIGPLEVDCLSIVNAIALSSFDMAPHGAGAGGIHWDCGFLSTQLAEVMPLAVIKGDGDKTWDTLDLLPLCAYLVGAVQQLAAKVETLDRTSA